MNKGTIFLELANKLPVSSWLSKNDEIFVNRCFAGDVVINMGEVDNKQLDFINKTVDELKKVNEAVSQAKSPITTTNVEEIKNNYIKPLIPTLELSDFQLKQIEMDIEVFLYELNPSIGIHRKNNLESMVAHNFTQLAVAAIAQKYHITYYNPFHFSLKDLMNLDRSGVIFSAIRDYLTQYTKLPNNYRIHNESHLKAELARYNKDNELEVIRLVVTGIQIVMKREIYGKETLERFRIYKLNDTDQVSTKFLEIYKELTNKDFAFYVKFPPSEDNKFFGHYESITKKKYRIPNLKLMCFSVLSELYLIDELKFGESVNQLGQDVLGQYLSYCFQDEKPSGGEIAVYLHRYLKSVYSAEVLDELFPFQPFIESMFKRHFWIFKASVCRIPQSVIKPPYDYNLLINVYDNIDLFKPKYIPKSNILLEQVLSDRPLAVQDKQAFIDNFNNNTSGFFTNFNFDNVVVIGGIMTCSLTGETAGFEQSDIDICFYGLSCSEIKNRVIEIVTKADKKYSNTSLLITDNDIIYCRHYPHRNIQFNCTSFADIQEVLIGVDIEASCFAFDGTNVWTTQRGVEAINYRTNFATPYGHIIRGENQYQRRLLKYLNRGFNVAYLPNNFIEEDVKNMNYGKYCSNGIEVLFKAKGNESIMQSLIKKSQKGSLPYGPNIDKEVFDKKVTLNHDQNFDGYNSSEWPSLITPQHLDSFEPGHSLETSINFYDSHFYHFILEDSAYDYRLDEDEDEDEN